MDRIQHACLLAQHPGQGFLGIEHEVEVGADGALAVEDEAEGVFVIGAAAHVGAEERGGRDVLACTKGGVCR